MQNKLCFNKWTVKLKPYKFQIIATTIHKTVVHSVSKPFEVTPLKKISSERRSLKWIDDRVEPGPCNQLENHSLAMGHGKGGVKQFFVTVAMHFSFFWNYAGRGFETPRTWNHLNRGFTLKKKGSKFKEPKILILSACFRWSMPVPFSTVRQIHSLFANSQSFFNYDKNAWGVEVPINCLTV